MNYQRHYDLLIERARHRVLVGYCERHHVVPRCLGGSNAKTNIVDLTAEEHYVAHQLLVHVYPGHMGLLSAALMMSSGSRFLQRNNKAYGWLRKRFSIRMTGRKVSPESVEKTAAKNRRKVRTDEFKAAVAAFHLGRKRPEETRQKMRASQIKSDETRAKLSDAHKGKVFSAESRAKMSAAKTGIPMSEETRRKISAANAGQAKPPVSDATRAKMRASRLAHMARVAALRADIAA